MLKFAVFDCEDAQKWIGHEKLYTEVFGGTGASWDVFKCWDKDLPDLEAAEQYRGIFISGSHYSAYEDVPWINDLVTWLRDFVERQHSTRIVAVCFGSQVLARALGGKVGKNPSQRFVLTVEELHLTEALSAKDYFTAAIAQQPAGKSDKELAATLRIIESHGDQVLELPPGAELLASSATAPNEVWTLGDRVLAFQGHPEMAPEEMLAKVHSTLSSNGRLSDEEAAASRAALEGTPPDNATIRRIMEAFVQQGAPSPPKEGSKAGEETPAETGISYGLTNWLPSVPMPAVSLPSLALPAWMPLPGLASSAPSAPATAASTAVSGRGTTNPPWGLLTDECSAVAAAGSAAVEGSPGPTGTPNAKAAVGSTSAASSVPLPAKPESAPSAIQEPPLLGGVPVASAKLPGSSEAARSSGEREQPSGSPALGLSEASGSGPPLELRPALSEQLQGPAASSAAKQAGERRAQLHAQAERLVDDLAGAFSAELDGAIANYELLFGVNTVSRAEFLHMHQELATWRPLIQEIQRKKDAIRPLSAALDGLEGRMDAVEGSIAMLDADTHHLARQLGIPLDA
ncbi:g2200 [Coccomyxa elongata]